MKVVCFNHPGVRVQTLGEAQQILRGGTSDRVSGEKKEGGGGYKSLGRNGEMVCGRTSIIGVEQIFL